ncbi:MAG: hypothetical protein WCS87_08475 [Methylococcaceae bacterium]
MTQLGICRGEFIRPKRDTRYLIDAFISVRSEEILKKKEITNED